MKKILLSVLILITFLTIGYALRSLISKPVPSDQLSEPTNSLPNTQQELAIITVQPVSQNKLSPSDVRTQIVSAIFSENYTPLSSSMTQEVDVRVEGTDCCGKIVYTEALKKLNDLRGGGTWSFVDSDERIGKLKTKSPNYYVDNNAVVGVSDNGYAVSFQLNNDGRIQAISFSTDFEKVLQ